MTARARARRAELADGGGRTSLRPPLPAPGGGVHGSAPGRGAQSEDRSPEPLQEMEGGDSTDAAAGTETRCTTTTEERGTSAQACGKGPLRSTCLGAGSTPASVPVSAPSRLAELGGAEPSREEQAANLVENTGGAALPTRFGRTWEEHVEAWKAAGRMVEDALWTRAAIAYSARATFKTKGVEEFAAAIKQTPTRIYQLARVFEAWPDEEKRFLLSFSHHQLAAATDDPRATLEKARAEGWTTVAKMRAGLGLAPAPSGGPGSPDPAPASPDARQARELADQAEAAQEAPRGPISNASRLDALRTAGQALYEEWDEAEPYEPLIRWAKEFTRHVEALEAARAARSGA